MAWRLPQAARPCCVKLLLVACSFTGLTSVGEATGVPDSSAAAVDAVAQDQAAVQRCGCCMPAARPRPCAPADQAVHEPVALRDASAFVQHSQRASSSKRRNPGRVYHLHIPRTGGTSFIKDMQRTSGHDVVSREGCYDWRLDLPGVHNVALMLRSPREHVLSQYLYCSEGPISFMTQTPRPKKFKEWIDAWVELQAKHQDVGDFSGSSTAEGADPDVKHQTYLPYTSLPFHCYNPINLQCQHLTCDRPFRYPNEADVERAIMNMQQTWFVGLVEAYQESLCLFNAKAAKKLPAFCDCRDEAKWNSFQPSHLSYHRRVTRTSHNVTHQPKEVLQAVDALTTADRVLYKAAVQRFVFEIHEIEQEHHTKILCYDATLLQRSLRDPLRMHFAMYVRDAQSHF